MENVFNPSEYENFKLDSIMKVIANSQHNRFEIIKEFDKLKHFYEQNPSAFFYSLEDTRNQLLEKDDLSDFERQSIEEIERILNDKEAVNTLFYYREELLLDDFKKIYRQIYSNSTDEDEGESYRDYFEVLFYSLMTKERDESVPVGECYSDGTINTGSKLEVQLMRISPTHFFDTYSTFHN